MPNRERDQKRPLRLPIIAFVMIGVIGYLVMVVGAQGLPPPGTEDPLTLLSAVTQIAPVWLVLWLLAAAGGAVHNWRTTGSVRGRVESPSGGSRLVCPVCGAPQVIRRGPGGRPRRVCSEAGEAHDTSGGDPQ